MTSAQEQVLISVIVPTYNRTQRCTRLLHALAEQTLDPAKYEVIVVDDCSPDDTQDVLRALVEEMPYRLRPMRAEVNAGAGPARNYGVTFATAPLIAFTDDDCVPDPGWLEAGLAAFTDPRTGVVQGRTLASDLDLLYSSRWAHGVIVDGPNSYFESCNIFYRREAIEAAGGFGVEASWWSSAAWCEDTLAGWSTLDAGWESGFAGDAVVTHDVDTRDLKWWVKTGLSHYREVAMAAQFPDYRSQTFWRSWAPRRDDAAFVAGVIGLVVAAKWKPAVLAAVPYAVLRRPAVKQSGFLSSCVATVVIDGSRTAGLIYGSLKQRIVVI